MDSAATAVEGMKLAAVVQLGYLAAEAGIAISLIPVTGGLSALIGAGAMRATQEVIKRLIKECVEEAVGYIVAAMTEPAVAALEGMAADLVVQLGSVALGFQDGVDLGQTGKAGKEGVGDGVQHATVTRDMLDEGTRARNSLRPPGFVHGTDHNQGRGHMLARMLGGSGDTLDNLFTITQDPTNTPDMRDDEQSIYNSVLGDQANGVAGQTVQYNVYLDYPDNRTDSVPKWIQIEANGKDGFQMGTSRINPDHAAQVIRRRQGIE